MKSVGFNKVYLKNNKIFKENPITELDFNSIAKGYAVDVISNFFDSKNIKNFIVEIGGKIRVKGINIENNRDWNIQLEKPNLDESKSYFKKIKLVNEAMATSGTYRKYYLDSLGRKYAHTINSKTGYGIERSCETFIW